MTELLWNHERLKKDGEETNGYTEVTWWLLCKDEEFFPAQPLLWNRDGMG